MHEVFAERVQAILDGDRDAALAVSKLAGRMSRGEFERSYLDIFFQYHWDATYSTVDAWVFGRLFGLAERNELQLLRLPVDREPSADAEIEANRAGLRSLPEPFVAQFKPGNSLDDDGHVRWDAEIIAGTKGWRWPPRDHVPLEVGFTRAATTVTHLRRFRWLARWPYGQSAAYVLHLTDAGWRSMFGELEVGEP